MNNFSALGASKRRRWVIVRLLLIGGALGALPKPVKVTKQSKFTSYTVTETLLANDTTIAQSGTTAISPNQLPVFATVGEVTARVKAKLKYAGREPATRILSPRALAKAGRAGGSSGRDNTGEISSAADAAKPVIVATELKPGPRSVKPAVNLTDAEDEDGTSRTPRDDGFDVEVDAGDQEAHNEKVT